MATDSPFTPTQHPFTGSNYPDKKTILSAYRRMVAMHIETAEAREALQRALKDFHSSLAVEELMENLKKVLNSPRRRPVYLAVRALIPSRLRDEYNSLIPHIPSNDRKEIQLFPKEDLSMGFSIRGGLEYGCGIFVSEVLTSSKAAQAGLKWNLCIMDTLGPAKSVQIDGVPIFQVGYEIVRVNGLTLCESTHEEVINLMKLKKKLVLTCKEVGMIPEQKEDSHELVWKAVGVDRRISKSRLDSDGPIVKSTKRIQISQEGDSLGISIKTGPNSRSGVIIVEVMPNSSADNAGLKPGDELIEVNGDSLINISHQQAIELFKRAGNSLMLTVKVKDDWKRSGAGGPGGGHYDPLANPPDNFELLPHDFDIDAEITPDVQLDYHSAFMLKPREGEQPREAKQSTAGDKSSNRFSVLDMDAAPSKGAPTIASPAALGYGPTLALPTLTQMAKAPPRNDGDDSTKEHDESTSTIQDQDMSLLNVSGKILDASITARHSVDFTTIGDVPASLAHLFNQQKTPDVDPSQGNEKFNLNMDELQSKQEEMLRKSQQREKSQPPAAAAAVVPEEDNARKKLAEDYQTYQFPVEHDEPTDTTDSVAVNKKPASSRSALKKVSVVANMEESKEKSSKHAGFKDSVEIIGDSTETNLEDSMASYPSVDHLVTDIHPSNMEFSDEVLKGRKVAFHTIPKEAPLKIAIRGGSNTALGGSIFISAIREGGAVEHYGKLNVGDQILVVDGISLIDVTHEEAVAALQRAMDMESTSIDLVIAEMPSKSDEQNSNDFSQHSRRSHTGHTMKNSDVNKVHQFLPKFPS